MITIALLFSHDEMKVNDKNVKTVDELKAAVASNKNVTISGFYPGYDGLYEYPLSLSKEQE
ncbi:MAG: hypothetical protein EOP47_19340 [Sphingobacteriaceae bacterium]|nr:MAG: hypothetical protein EOP47_19340 [Sphingobacteriaceae bacterium]